MVLFSIFIAAETFFFFLKSSFEHGPEAQENIASILTVSYLSA